MARPLLSARTRGSSPPAALTPGVAFAPVLSDVFFSDRVLAVADFSLGAAVFPVGGLAEDAPYSAGLFTLSGCLSTRSPTARACFRAGCVASGAGGNAGPLSVFRYTVSTAACWVCVCLLLPGAMIGSFSHLD